MTTHPSHHHTTSRVAVVTGGSAGLGLELVRALAQRGWTVVTDARTGKRLDDAVADLDGVVAVAGDVTDPVHRTELVATARRLGQVELLINNVSTLGPLPLRTLTDLEPDELARVWAVNVGGPVELSRALAPDLGASCGMIISISSDAAVQHYETWGAYGATKAALDHLTLTLGEESGIASYAVDPGDMRTQMHADAFVGEDISDRPLPQTVVPHLLGLIDRRPAPGRYVAAEVAPAESARTGAVA